MGFWWDGIGWISVRVGWVFIISTVCLLKRFVDVGELEKELNSVVSGHIPSRAALRLTELQLLMHQVLINSLSAGLGQTYNLCSEMRCWHVQLPRWLPSLMSASFCQLYRRIFSCLAFTCYNRQFIDFNWHERINNFKQLILATHNDIGVAIMPSFHSLQHAIWGYAAPQNCWHWVNPLYWRDKFSFVPV